MKKIQLIIIIIVTLLFSHIILHFGIIYVPNIDNLIGMQFNLLTVSTVFAGFSFTVLGLIISLSDTSVLKNLRETSFIRSYCDTVIKSIVFFMISIVSSLYFIFGINSWIENYTKGDTSVFSTDYPYIFGLLFLIYGIILFCKSVYKVSKTMNAEFKINEDKGKEKVERFKKAIDKK